MTPTERVSALETLLERIRRNAAEPRVPRAPRGPLPPMVTASWVTRSEPVAASDLLPGPIDLPGEREREREPEEEPPTFDPARAMATEAARRVDDAGDAHAEDSQREPDEPATLVRDNSAPQIALTPSAGADAAADSDEGVEVDFDDVEIVDDPTLDVTSAAHEVRELHAAEIASAETARAELERLDAERREDERLQAERLAADRDEAERVSHAEIMRQVADAARQRAVQEAEEEERRAAEEQERAEQERRAGDERRELEEAERFEAELVARELRRAQERVRSMPPRPEPEIDRIEAERLRREQIERAEADRVAGVREDARRQAIEEAERQAVERAEADRLARAEAAAARREEEERREAERIAREEGARLLAEQNARREEEERREAARVAEQERLEAERLGAERQEAERLEAERLEAEHAETERLEAERLEAEHAETERLAAEHEAQSLAVTAERASAATLLEASAQSTGEPEHSGVVEATPISSRQPKQDDYRGIDDGFGEMLDAEEAPPESGEVQSQRKPTIHEEPTLVAALDEWSAEASAPGEGIAAAREDAAPFAEVSRVSTRPPARPESVVPRPLPLELQGDVIRRPPASGEAASFVGVVGARDALSFGDLLEASLSLAPR